MTVKWLWASVLAVVPLAMAQNSPTEIPYDAVEDFFKLPPNLYFGEVAGVAVNSKKHVFVLSRGNTTGPAYGAAAAQLLEFGPDGKFVREIGHNLYGWSFAHSVRIESASDESAHPLEHPKPPLTPVDGMFRQVTRRIQSLRIVRTTSTSLTVAIVGYRYSTPAVSSFKLFTSMCQRRRTQRS